MMKLPYPLDGFGALYTSQNDEDGIIAAIIERIPLRRYFVEFGAHQEQCNCLHLWKQGWPGLFMDMNGDNVRIMCEKVSPDNINGLLQKYKVPDDFGVLSVDIDGQDIWVWQAMTCRPPLVVIEYNDLLPVNQPVAMPRDDNFPIAGAQHWGASLYAMNLLGTRKGYVLVYCNHVNAFFVRRDCFDNPADFPYSKVCHPVKFERIRNPLEVGYVEVNTMELNP